MSDPRTVVWGSRQMEALMANASAPTLPVSEFHRTPHSREANPAHGTHGEQQRHPSRNLGPGPNPSGLCECGCGGETPLAKQSNPYGLVRGKPTRYIAGHQFKRRARPRRRRAAARYQATELLNR